MKRMCALLVVVFVLLPALPVRGDTSSPDSSVQHRPRIGLVLSGGGALGSAHVGVLEVLEELRVPIDCVAGTSMGAIVGGLYASGVSPREMEEILATTDWRNLLDDRPPRRHLPYRRKVDDQTYLTRFEAGFNGGSFQLPPGLVSGQKLGFALQQMALQAVGIDDFDRLPIPFRAATTDLETGELVVLRGGDLGQAIRASMSVPGIFSPVVIDGRTLIDGGLARNLPVDLAREMGADVIIAVDVSTQPDNEGKPWSIGSVTSQVIGLGIARNVRQQAEDADLVIRPRLEGFSSSDFERSPEMVPHGVAAAREVAAQLAAFSIPEEEYRARIERIRKRRTFDGAKVTSIELTKSSTADTAFVMRQVKTRPGDPLDLEAIRKDLERLYETGDFERVDARLEETDGGFALFIEAIDKPWGPNLLRFGLNVFADLEGESSFDILTNYTMTRLNRRRGELKVQARVGENPAIAFELYQPFSIRQTWFASVIARQGTTTEYLPVPGAAGTVSPYRIDAAEFEGDLGLQLGRWAELRLGLFGGAAVSELRGAGDVPPPGLPERIETDLAGFRATAVVDQFDNMNFPREGYFVYAEYLDSRTGLGADIDYERFVGFAGVAGTRGRHTLLGLSNFYSALGSASPEVYTLGGLFRLSGFPVGSIRGQYGGNVSALYLFRVADLPIGLGDGIYLAGSIEAGNLWSRAADVSLSDVRYAGSVSLGADTTFGPVYLAAGFGEGGEHALYLFVGRTF